jgi:SSS family solute:Na+ symporter
VLSGYVGTALNSLIQGVIMLIGIAVVVVAVLNVNGGFMESVNLMSQQTSETVAAGGYSSIFGPDPVGLLGVVLLTSLGTWGLPQMIGKFYAIKSEKSIKTGTVVSTVFAVIVAGGCYFLGGFGRLFSDKVDVATEGFDAIVPTMLSELSPFLIAVVVILVLSASISTLSSLVLTSSSTLTLDFIKGGIVKHMSEKKQLLTMRGLIVVFIGISVVLAIIQYNSNVTFIAQLMGISWGALAGAFLAPFLFGLYWKRTTRAAVWVSFGFSSIVMIANILFRSSFPVLLQSPINAGAFCMIAGLVLVPVVSLVTPKLPKAHLDQVFSCYDRMVTVSVKDSIGEQSEN